MRRSTELNCLGEFGKREWGWEGGEGMGLWAESAKTFDGEYWNVTYLKNNPISI